MTVFNIVNSSTTIQTPRATFAGFGRGVILHSFTGPQETAIGASYFVVNASNWKAKLTEYGVPDSDILWVALNVAFGQALKVDQLAVLVASTKVAQTGDLTVTENVDGVYSVTIDGTTFSHTAAAQTAAQIMDALAALIDADARFSCPATATGTISYAVDQAGLSHVVTPSSPNDLMTHTLTQAAVGYVSDLTAYTTTVTSDFWAILETNRNTAEQVNLAQWAQGEIEKVAFLMTHDANAEVSGESTNLGAQLKARNLSSAAAFYHPTTGDVSDFGLVFGQLPKTPGSLTWHMQDIAGVTGFVPSDRSALLEHRYNWNELFSAVSGSPTASQEGVVASGNWIDEIRGRDAFARDLRETKFLRFKSLDKVTYDEDGVDVLVGCLIDVVERWDGNGFLDADTLTFTTIAVADIPSDIRATRCYYGIDYDVKMTGAIHKLSNPSGGPGITGSLYA